MHARDILMFALISNEILWRRCVYSGGNNGSGGSNSGKNKENSN